MHKTVMTLFLATALTAPAMEKLSVIPGPEQKITLNNPLIQLAVSYHLAKSHQLTHFQKKIFNESASIGTALILTGACAYWNPRYTRLFGPVLFLNILRRLGQKDFEIARPCGTIAHTYFKSIQKIARATH